MLKYEYHLGTRWVCESTAPSDVVAWDGNLADGIAGPVSPFSGARMGSICLDGLTHATVVKEDLIFPPGLSGCFHLAPTHANLHRSRSGAI